MVSSPFVGSNRRRIEEREQIGVALFLFQFERFDKRRNVLRAGVHVVAVPGLARSAMTAAVMSNAAVSMVAEEEHLAFNDIC